MQTAKPVKGALIVQHNSALTEAAMKALHLSGLGLEVAPYFDPFIKKSEYDVLYTDHISTEEIRDKTKENPTFLGVEVAPVDFVWKPATSLRECTPVQLEFDYVVASHVMEHVPNPIGWLNEILSVTKVGGKIALFLPNRRGTADFYRNVTSFSEIVDLWLSQPNVPTSRQVADFMAASFMNNQGGNNFFHDLVEPASSERCYTDAEAIDSATFVPLNNNYIDVHATVWEPAHFVSTFHRLKETGLINVDISEPTSEVSEFLVVLTKLGTPLRIPPNRTVLKLQAVTQAVSEMDHRLDVLHHENTHMQQAIFHDLGFLIQRDRELHDQIHSMQQQTSLLIEQVAAIRRQTQPRWKKLLALMTQYRQKRFGEPGEKTSLFVDRKSLH
jgi:SAM-dependent methyltransferase